MSEKSENENKEKLTMVSELGEFGLIERLTMGFDPKQPSTVLGIGDDAAAFKMSEGKLGLLSTDTMVEGVHFDLSYSPLKHIGYKAVVSSISDIYAMNGKPTSITISLAISSRYTVEALDELYKGVRNACRYYAVDLVGGDVTSSLSGLMIGVSVLGEVDEAKMSRRSGAKEGDYVVVSGSLGSAYLGLQVLEREKRVFLEDPEMKPEIDEYLSLVERQLKPEARFDVVDVLREAGVVPSSMIDVSDGLSSELLHICKASNTGCEIHEENIPIEQLAMDLAMNEFKISPVTCALSGGEDYELLMTMPISDFQKVDGKSDLKVIGRIVSVEKGLKLTSPSGEQHDIIAQGWNHLQKK